MSWFHDLIIFYYSCQNIFRGLCSIVVCLIINISICMNLWKLNRIFCMEIMVGLFFIEFISVVHLGTLTNFLCYKFTPLKLTVNKIQEVVSLTYHNELKFACMYIKSRKTKQRASISSIGKDRSVLDWKTNYNWIALIEELHMVFRIRSLHLNISC